MPAGSTLRIALDVSAVPARPVGAGWYTIRIAAGLSERADLAVTLVARRNDAERWRTIAPAARVVACVPERRPLRLAWEATRAGRAASDLDVDVWHGPHYTMPRGLAIPAVVTVHDLTFFDQPEHHERMKVPFFRRAIRTSARAAARLVCVSRTTLERLDAVVPDHAPAIVAHHGIDHDRFLPAADPEDAARLASHGIRPPYIGFVGTLEPRKNLGALVDAFARLATQRPELQLVLAGSDGWATDDLMATIRTSGVATRILRPGYLPDATVPALYRQAAAIAYPSHAEGFGMPALEALACGAVLVTSSGTAMDEFVGDAAITFDPRDRDPDALARALERALDPDTAAGSRARGPAQAAMFTWPHSVARHVDAYHAAVASHGQKARR